MKTKLYLNNAFGYKVCYIKRGNTSVKKHTITNTYSLASLEKQLCEKYPQRARATKRFIKNATWHIEPVKHKSRYRKLWRKCPF